MRDQYTHIDGDLWGPIISMRGQADDRRYGTGRSIDEGRKTAIFDRDGPLNEIHDRYHDDRLQEERGSQTLPEFTAAVHGNADQYGTASEDPHISDLFAALKDDGHQIAVVTNQPDVQKGDRLLNRETVHAMNTYLLDSGADIVVACPHPAPNWEAAYADDEAPVPPRWPDDPAAWDCRCHKPRAGMFRFLDEFRAIDYTESFMVGDSPSDLAAADTHTDGRIDQLYFIQEYPVSQKTAPELADESFPDFDTFATTCSLDWG